MFSSWKRALRTTVVGIVAALVLSSVPLPVQAEYSLLQEDEVAEFMDDFFGSRLDRITGGVVTVVTKDKVLFERGYGFADKEKKLPADSGKTRYPIGSITKLFTATAVMQLYEQGVVRLDEDINRYLPTPIKAGKKPITLEHLLTHTAGFDEMVDIGEKEWSATGDLGDWEEVRVPSVIREPGTVKSYSNFGMSLAGYIAQVKSGQPFAEYISEHITGPLGMEMSGFRLTNEMRADWAVAYDSKGAPMPKIGLQSFYVPGGAMVSTGSDMSTFMRAILNGGALSGTRLLKTDTLDQMTNLHASYAPQLGGMSYGFYTTIRKGYKILEHGGDLSGWHSGLWLIPEEGAGVFLSINGNDLAFREEFMKAFMDRFFLTAQPASLSEGTPPAEEYPSSKYAGVFMVTRFPEASFFKIGSLFDDGLKIRVSQVDDKTLRVRQGDGQADYQRETSGVWVNDSGSFAARQTADGFFLQMSNSAIVDYRKLEWYEDKRLHVGLLGFFLTALITCGVWSAVIFYRNRKLAVLLPMAANWTHLALVAGLVALSGIVGVSSDWQTIFRLLLALSPTAVVLSAIAAGLAIARKGRMGANSVLSSWILGITIALQLLFAWYLSYWNLFGWSGFE